MSAKAELAPPTLTSSPAVEAWATSRSGPSATSSAAFEVALSVRLTPMRAPVPSSERTGAATESTPSTPRSWSASAASSLCWMGRGAGDVDVGGVGGAGGEGALDVLVRLRGLGVGGERAGGVVVGGVEGGAAGEREHRAARGERHPAGTAGDQLTQPLEQAAVRRRLPALRGPEHPRADDRDRGRDQGQAREQGDRDRDDQAGRHRAEEAELSPAAGRGRR